jgi:hypothetical protein
MRRFLQSAGLVVFALAVLTFSGYAITRTPQPPPGDPALIAAGQRLASESRADADVGEAAAQSEVSNAAKVVRLTEQVATLTAQLKERDQQLTQARKDLAATQAALQQTQAALQQMQAERDAARAAQTAPSPCAGVSRRRCRAPRSRSS